MFRTQRWTMTAITCLALTGITAGPALAGEPPADPPALDNAYLRAGHQGNLTEIGAGRDAEKHANSACVKQAGAVLVRDHTKLDADTKALANKLGVDLPTAPTPEQQKTLAGVMTKAGTDGYDKTWLAEMATAHEKTLARIDTQIAKGKKAEITAAAKAARPVVAAHLAMVRGGGCHQAAAPHTIDAGKGGKAVLAADVPVAVAVPAVALGGFLVAAGAFWAAARLRRHDSRYTR
ncbi:DUF4142 domain-containing protein [Streptomyces sp. LP05-1]|uniref:DUF4142 domain-containing protein n=1 Tax=Streptomyces pyxinae TaxID=2970734 RepID=A0ABT2CMZ1_9ACTN|nr:DUF4142 domain-containing protein [Streptomyces sp. LP05-1]MCS0638616.1 DUF4142 domain-containing protein [Streptomyces sp. LP05-1]